ncbi:MAG: radical SAM protein [Proteobacteria bacterium]|nr:radical SAM protein [Pseudomonadota bacterium]
MAPLAPEKFRDPLRTARGELRARVALRALETLWFNTGTLCNLACTGCYIESSPRNDRLAYLTRNEVRAYLDEIREAGLPTTLIGFTGGEPFMNPDLPDMLEDCLGRGFQALVLTNAMKPMQKQREQLLALQARHGAMLTLRVSLDHYTQPVHEEERGARSWRAGIDGLLWLAANGFRVNVAARRLTGETEAELRAGFARLFATLGLALDAQDPVELAVFPEMDPLRDVPEITEACWGILGRAPDSVMCANARMVVKHRNDAAPTVVACTLLPYDPRFAFGATLASAAAEVALNHPYCASFCVLGGAACSRG